MSRAAPSPAVRIRCGYSPTAKFWISPEGQVIPLRGQWHYHWALRKQHHHGVDLGSETTEQPVRLRMIGAGWWRVNYERKQSRMTIEGAMSQVNPEIVAAVTRLAEQNVHIVNGIRINLLLGDTARRSIWISTIEDETEKAIREIEQFFATGISAS